MLSFRRYLQTLPLKNMETEQIKSPLYSFKNFTVLHDPIPQVCELTNSIFSSTDLGLLNQYKKISKTALDDKIVPDLKNSIITSRIHDTMGYLVPKSRLANSLAEQMIIYLRKYNLIDPGSVPFRDLKISLSWNHWNHLINVTNSEGIVVCNKKPANPIFGKTKVRKTINIDNVWKDVYSPYFGMYKEEKVQRNYVEPPFYPAGYYPNLYFYSNPQNSEINYVLTQGNF